MADKHDICLDSSVLEKIFTNQATVSTRNAILINLALNGLIMVKDNCISVEITDNVKEEEIEENEEKVKNVDQSELEA